MGSRFHGGGMERSSRGDADERAADNTAKAIEPSGKGEIGGGETHEKTEPYGNGITNCELPEKGEKLDWMTKEVVEGEDTEVDAHFIDFQEAHWGESPQGLEQKREIVDKSLEMGKKPYREAAEIAGMDKDLDTFSDHTDRRHVKQVIEKSVERNDYYRQLCEAHPEIWEDTFSKDTSENTLIFAAALHDTGMAGEVSKGDDAVEAYRKRVANEDQAVQSTGVAIRKTHSCEGAMYALSQRENVETMNRKLREVATEDSPADEINVDEAAMIIALHSKSAEMGENSATVKDTSDTTAMLKYAEELKSVSAQHSLEFHDDFLYKVDESGARVPDMDAIRRISTEVSALREGDAFRPASEVQVTQSGKAVVIDATKFNPDATDIGEELANVEVAFYNLNGTEAETRRLGSEASAAEPNSNNVLRGKAYAVGEKNISDIRGGEVGRDGDLVTDVYLHDGNTCPLATGFAINERVKETASINSDKLSHMVYRIHSEAPMDARSCQRMERMIEEPVFRQMEIAEAEDVDEVEEETVNVRDVKEKRDRIRIEFV